MPLTQPASVPLRLQSGWNTGISAGKVALSSMLKTWVTQSRATSHQPRSSPRRSSDSAVTVFSPVYPTCLRPSSRPSERPVSNQLGSASRDPEASVRAVALDPRLKAEGDDLVCGPVRGIREQKGEAIQIGRAHV